MERHLPVSFILFFFSIYLPASCAADKEHFVFSGFDDAGKLTRDGVATVSSERILELTNNEENAKGHAFYPTPFRFKESPNGTAKSFSANFIFAIIPGYSDSISTDGMAFLVSPKTNLSEASPAQYMGFLDSAVINRTFAVEFDTVSNLELKDIDGNHIGIDIASRFSTPGHAAGFFDEKDGTFNDLNLDSGQAMQVWVDYDGMAKQIDVTLAPLGLDKPSKPLLSNIFDLSSVLTEKAYVGFSAATGPIKSRHCVLAWNFAIDGPELFASEFRVQVPMNSNRIIVAFSVLVSSAVTAVLLVAVVLAVRRCCRYREIREDWEIEFGPHRFSYKDLFHATNGFKDNLLLGAGGFGKVYKGVLPSSKLEVAVKVMSHDAKQGMKGFIAEVVCMGRLRHRNLVQLLGYCRRKGELLLVYEYMSNGSLDKHLYDTKKPSLGWAHRYGIIKGVASGLLYLHEEWEQVVIHRDIKASNVLLDQEMNGQLGDFGLARLHDHGVEAHTTCVAGTRGYISPELARLGKATKATDVFAFGAFVLEVACGRRPIAVNSLGEPIVLVDFVLKFLQNNLILCIIDPRLGGEYVEEEAELVLKLGLLCSHPSPVSRPSMRLIMQYLCRDMPFPEMPDVYLNIRSMNELQVEGGFSEEEDVQCPSAQTSITCLSEGR